VDELRREFHDDLASVQAKVIAMGADVVDLVSLATDALLENDAGRAADAAAADGVIDDAYANVETTVYRLVARQGPVARDLRFLVGSLRVAQELERCGDLAVGVARRGERIDETVLTPAVRLIIHELGAEAVSMLAGAMRAYRVLDDGLASAVIAGDEAMDDLYAKLLAELFALRGVASEPLVEAGLVARFFERLGDHAAVISERVRFVNGSAFEANDSDSS
jgi:phosphate transport system protein